MADQGLAGIADRTAFLHPWLLGTSSSPSRLMQMLPSVANLRAAVGAEKTPAVLPPVEVDHSVLHSPRRSRCPACDRGDSISVAGRAARQRPARSKDRSPIPAPTAIGWPRLQRVIEQTASSGRRSGAAGNPSLERGSRPPHCHGRTGRGAFFTGVPNSLVFAKRNATGLSATSELRVQLISSCKRRLISCSQGFGKSFRPLLDLLQHLLLKCLTIENACGFRFAPRQWRAYSDINEQ